MDPFTMMLIGGGLGLAKSELIDRPKEARQRKLAAETQRYSPWTGLRANAIQEADPFASALKYGTTGASMGAANQQAEFDKALTDRLNSGGSIRGSGQNFMAQKESNPWNSKYLGGSYDFGG